MAPYPLGPPAARQHGLSEEFGYASTQNVKRALTKMSKTAMSLPGTAFDVTDEDLEQWASQFEKDCHNIGCDILLGVTVGRKPL